MIAATADCLDAFGDQPCFGLTFPQANMKTHIASLDGTVVSRRPFLGFRVDLREDKVHEWMMENKTEKNMENGTQTEIIYV